MTPAELALEPAWVRAVAAQGPALTSREVARLRGLATAPAAVQDAAIRFPPGSVVGCVCGDADCHLRRCVAVGVAEVDEHVVVAVQHPDHDRVHLADPAALRLVLPRGGFTPFAAMTVICAAGDA